MDEWYLRNASLWFDIRIPLQDASISDDGDVRSTYGVSPTLALDTGEVDRTVTNAPAARHYTLSSEDRGTQVARGG